MPYRVLANPALAIIELSLEGALSIDDVRKLTDSVLDIAQKTGYLRVLADCENYERSPLIGDVYFHAKSLAESFTRPRGWQAIIAPRLPEVAEDVRFYACAARNRGRRVEVFATRAEALRWLLDTPSTPERI